MTWIFSLLFGVLLIWNFALTLTIGDLLLRIGDLKKGLHVYPSGQTEEHIYD